MLAAVGALPSAAPARAEVGLGVSIVSDDRFRGRSVSDDRPAATVSLSYDDYRGPYLGGSLTITTGDSAGLKPLRTIQYGGYAHRLSPELTIDVGVVNRVYFERFGPGYASSFVEIYLGLAGRNGTVHIYHSPDYDGRGGSATYGEVDALLFRHGDWSLSGHLGLLAPPEQYRRRHPEVDWRLSASRSFDRLSVSLHWVGASSGQATQERAGSVSVAASWSF